MADIYRTPDDISVDKAIAQHSDSGESGSKQFPHFKLHLNVFKLYLGRILGDCTRVERSEDDPLHLYQHEPRSAVGSVLVSTKNLGVPGPYIPLFYQECPCLEISASIECDNAIMQQPLAHLYFMTVLEHLVARKWDLSWLIVSASSIRTLCDSPSTIDSDKVLLWIELQAVVQVIAQNVPYHLLPSQRVNIVQFAPLKDDINKLLNDDSMGGGGRQGHALVVALHLFKLLKSSQTFTELMTRDFDEIIRQVECLKSFGDQVQIKSQQEPKQLFLPILLPKDGEQAALYKRVSNIMVDIHKKENGKADLISIAEECRDSQASTSVSIKLLSFRMIVWLVSYYEFYEKMIRSTVLCDFIGSDEMSTFLQGESYVHIIQCFLNPGLMINCPEVPNPLNEHEQVLELHVRGHRPARREVQEKDDPLFRLFHQVKQDQSNVDLRQSIAVMIAVVMGLPSRSNHLWYHTFAADELANTYMTGFMYGSKVNQEGLLYDCGVELTPDGKFGRQDYMEHANRGTYTLHSLYPLLWANFGAFCIALLTQPDAYAKIHGNIISDRIPVRHYCVSQLKSMWVHMRNNYGISEEERTFFVIRAMKAFYEFMLLQVAPTSLEESQRGNTLCSTSEGYFKTQHDLDEYELSWHLSVYQPAWNELLSKFNEYSQDWQSELCLKIRQLALLYPQFPSEQDFIHLLLKSDNLQQQFWSGEETVLTRFSMEWPRLKVGGRLLPKLVKLYQWLHTHLAYIITYEKAATLSLRRVIELAMKRYNKSMDEDILGLYESLKTDYNEYVDQLGGAICAGARAANRHWNKIYTISDGVCLLHFLTDNDDEEAGNDWLFTVIEDIVSAHNLVIESLYSSVLMCTERQSRLNQWLPEEPATRCLTEMDDTNCLVGDFKSLHGMSHYLQVVRSRCLLPLKSDALGQQGSEQVAFSINGQPKNSPVFQLIQLDKDIVTYYIAGKPLITDTKSLRTIFQFRQSQKAADVIPSDDIHSPADLEAMTKNLPDTFKKEMDVTMIKRFAYDFHSVNHHVMIEVITGLRSVVGHLIKELIYESRPSQQLQELTVSEFMRGHYVVTATQKEHEVLYEVGITSLNSAQFDCLLQLPLPCCVSCMLHFANWVEEGSYDFSTKKLLYGRFASKPKTVARNEKKKTSSTAKRLPSTEETSCDISVTDVATFLASMKMDKYQKQFTDEYKSGDVLLELTSDGLSELGVDSALDKLKILVGFRQFIETGEVNFSTSKLINALKAGNLEEYSKHFEQHEVDGELLLYTGRELVIEMFDEIGISSKLTCARIIAQFRKYRTIQ